jgi:transporter family-2 protein
MVRRRVRRRFILLAILLLPSLGAATLFALVIAGQARRGRWIISARLAGAASHRAARLAGALS